jgi:hypothetical protein
LVEVDQRLAGRLLLAGLSREEAAAVIASGAPLLRTQKRDEEYWQAYAANRVRDGSRLIEGVPENPQLTRWNQTEKAHAVKIAREIDEKARLAPSQTRRDPSAADSDEIGHLFQSMSDTIPILSDSCRSEATLFVTYKRVSDRSQDFVTSFAFIRSPF